MSMQSSPNIFDLWDTYHKVVAANLMFHREIAQAMRQALAAKFSGRRPAFLDLGCGDATALVPILRDFPPSRYKGVDLSETALALAARELANLPCPVTLAHGDIIEALAEDDSYDVIHSSFALHHLPTEQKGEFFRRALLRLAPGGLLLLVDVVREEDESLDDYMRGYCAWVRRDWTGLSAEERDAVCDHLVNNDLPETLSTLLALARAAGLQQTPGGVQYGAHRLVCFARD
jgi:SAM-dependent methyltransferase